MEESRSRPALRIFFSSLLNFLRRLHTVPSRASKSSPCPLRPHSLLAVNLPAPVPTGCCRPPRAAREPHARPQKPLGRLTAPRAMPRIQVAPHSPAPGPRSELRGAARRSRPLQWLPERRREGARGGEGRGAWAGRLAGGRACGAACGGVGEERRGWRRRPDLGAGKRSWRGEGVRRIHRAKIRAGGRAGVLGATCFSGKQMLT